MTLSVGWSPTSEIALMLMQEKSLAYFAKEEASVSPTVEELLVSLCPGRGGESEKMDEPETVLIVVYSMKSA